VGVLDFGTCCSAGVRNRQNATAPTRRMLFPIATSLLLTDRTQTAERLEEAALLLKQIEVISQITAAQRGTLVHFPSGSK